MRKAVLQMDDSAVYFDRADDLLLYPAGGNNDLWQMEAMTAGEIREGLEGYIRLRR